LKIIDKYIIKHLIFPYLFGIFGFFIVLSIDPLIRVMKYLVSYQNTPAAMIWKWYLYKIPEDFVYVFPMAMLLSTMLCFGTLSKDSEIIACYACGLSFKRLVVPVLFFASFITLFAFLFSEFVVPYTSPIQEKLNKEIKGFPDIKIRENIVTKNINNDLIYIKRLDLMDDQKENENSKLKNIIITSFKNNIMKRRIIAQSAIYKNSEWLFQNGYIIEYKVHNRDDHLIAKANKDEFFLNEIKKNSTFLDFFDISRDSEMIESYIRFTDKPRKFDFTFKPNYLYNLNEEIKNLSAKNIKYKIDSGKKYGNETIKLLVEFHLKYSIAFSCFIFAIIGSCMGISSKRSGTFVNFGISMFIIFIYYILMSIFRSFGRTEIIPSAFLAAWLQNVIFIIYGIFLIIKVSNR
jgi:lipopolysaccharide export system permease protein